LVFEEVGRVDQLDPFARQLRRDAADEGVGVAAREREEQLQHPHVGERAAENLDVPDLPRHDRLLHALALEEADHPPQLADADPRHAFGHLLYLRVGLLPDGRDRHLRARAPRALQHEEGEPAVARYQTESHKQSTEGRVPRTERGQVWNSVPSTRHFI
jgi:hypothetical protein